MNHRKYVKREVVSPFKSENSGINDLQHETMQYHAISCNITPWSLKPCNITPWSLIISQFYETWSHAISHLGRWLFHSSMRVIKLQPVFKVCNISYLYVLFHSSELLLTFWYINHKMIKGKEWIHVTTNIIQYHILR